MYILLGWLNVAAVIVMTAPYWLRLINKYAYKSKNAALTRAVKKLRAVHKPLGVVLLVLVVIHGVLALGVFRLHTGTIAGGILLITVVLGGSFYRLKKKPLYIAHRTAATLLTLFVLLHLIYPSAIWYLFGL